MKQPNRSKAAMRANRKAYGCNLSCPSPLVIGILGKIDLDFVFIQGEQVPFGLDQLEDLCRTAERHNLTMITGVPNIGASTLRTDQCVVRDPARDHHPGAPGGSSRPNYSRCAHKCCAISFKCICAPDAG